MVAHFLPAAAARQRTLALSAAEPAASMNLERVRASSNCHVGGLASPSVTDLPDACAQ